MTTEELSPELQKYVGRVSGFVEGPDEVNKAMIRHWCETVEDGASYKKCEGGANQT
ncbi:MAG: hypothetical protein WBC61_05945 [Dehalococcoidia bacterium]